MKKFWIVLLAMAFVAGFAMSASAADVKFSGQYYVIGSYVDNPANLKDGAAGRINAAALYNQRLRVQTEFKVAEGLSLVTRFDAIEKDWGDFRWRGEGAGRVDNVSRPAVPAVAGQNVQESIEFERVYVDFTTKIGRFMVGYQNFIAFGTMFMDSHATRAGIKYFVPMGPVTMLAAIEKLNERSIVGAVTDADNNNYDLGFVYKFGAGDAGLMFQYADHRRGRTDAGATQGALNAYLFDPYVKMKFGPVYFEAEGLYGFGKLLKRDAPTAALPDVDVEAFALYLHGKGDLGPAYVGGIFAWASGDDITTPNKREGGLARALVAGQAWDPCLLLFNDGTSRANTGAIGAAIAFTPYDVFFDNAWLYQLYAGFKPTPKADIMLSLTYVTADKNVVANQVSKNIGTEIDLVAKYKIFDNLEYMAGAAYLMVGDYWKGADANRQIANNYLLIHKLTLNF